jgi:hypothetical protein
VEWVETVVGVMAVVVVAHEVTGVALGETAVVVTGILEEVVTTVVDGEMVIHGRTVGHLVMTGAQAAVVVVEDQVMAIEVAIGAVTILMVAISRIMVEGLLEAALVQEDQALIQVVAVDMAQVVEWEDMAGVRVGTKLSQIHYIVPSLVLILLNGFAAWAGWRKNFTYTGLTRYATHSALSRHF